MKHLFSGRTVQIILLLLLITICMPVQLKMRSFIIAKTPIILPADENTVYSMKYYKKYEKLIAQASEEFDVPAPLIAAVIKAESGFNPYAVSGAGAMGLMQIMPETWDALGGAQASPFNAGHNIRLGTKYLRELMVQFRGNLRLTIAAYNAGPGAVQRYRRVPPYSETRRYVPKVMRFYRNYSKVI